MAVRWRTRRTAPARADDGRWGVARLVAQREAARRVRTGPCTGTAPGTDAGPSAPADPAPGAGEPFAPPAADPAGSVPPAGDPEDTADPVAQPAEDAADPAAQPAEGTVPDPRAPRPASPGTPVPPAPRRAPTGPAPDLPAPRRPRRPSGEGPVYRPLAVSARPPVDPEPGLLGFSRLTRSRTGARAFTLFFVAIYLVILIQTLSTIV